MKMIIFLFSLLFFISGCSESYHKKELRVGILDWTGYEPLALADSMGLYDTDEIKVVRFPSVIDVLGAMRNGTIDVAALTLDESLVYAQENQEIRAFLVCDISDGGDAIVAKKGIHDPSQLKGLRIGAEESALSSFILHRFLEKSGLNHEDIHTVPIRYDIHDQAFISDMADAVITYNPAKDRLVVQGGNVIFDSSQMEGEIIDVLIGRDSVLKSNRKNVLHLVKGWYKALEYMKRHPEKSNEMMAVFEGISSEDFERAMKGIRIPERSEAIAILESGKKMEKDPDGFVANMRSHGLLRKDISFTPFYTSEYLLDP